jgi:hypothetical protein
MGLETTVTAATGMDMPMEVWDMGQDPISPATLLCMIAQSIQSCRMASLAIFRRILRVVQ